MTEIKKYRRRVSDERVDYIATETENHHATVRAILEADAEVTEAICLSCEDFEAGKYTDKIRFVKYSQGDTEYILLCVKEDETYTYAMTLEQFNAEWEEIKE